MSPLNAENAEAAAQQRSAAASSRQRDDSRVRRTSSHDLDRTSHRHASSAQPSSGQSTDGQRGLPDAEDQQADLPRVTGEPSGQHGPPATGQQPSQSYGGALPGAPSSDSLPGPPARLPAPSLLPGPPPWPPARPDLQVQYLSLAHAAYWLTQARSSQHACSNYLYILHGLVSLLAATSMLASIPAQNTLVSTDHHNFHSSLALPSPAHTKDKSHDYPPAISLSFPRCITSWALADLPWPF